MFSLFYHRIAAISRANNEYFENYINKGRGCSPFFTALYDSSRSEKSATREWGLFLTSSCFIGTKKTFFLLSRVPIFFRFADIASFDASAIRRFLFCRRCAFALMQTAVSVIPAASFARVNVIKTQSTETPQIGEDFTYTIDLTNSGNLDATSVLVTDELPANFSLESVEMVSNGITTVLDPSDYSYEDNLLTIPSSTSTLELTVPVNGELRFILNGRFTSAD